MAKVTVLVCDECASQDQVKHYEVREAERKATIDLCGTHSEWVEQLLGKRKADSPARKTSRSRTPKVTTMEEIEARKKKS